MIAYRVCDPSWVDPAGELDAVVLFASLARAAEEARRCLQREFGGAVTFGDLRAALRPDVQTYDLPERFPGDGARDIVLARSEMDEAVRTPTGRLSFADWYPGLA